MSLLRPGGLSSCQEMARGTREESPRGVRDMTRIQVRRTTRTICVQELDLRTPTGRTLPF
jgi:hypothetical protein